jgi:polysaccharide biosynthesis protein PelC
MGIEPRPQIQLLKITMTNIMKKPQLLALLLLVSGCATVVHDDGKSPVNAGESRMMMPPFVNATDHEHAGQALTQLTGSILLKYGLPLHQTEEILGETAGETESTQEASHLRIARDNQADYLLIGVVHEYRYKPDLRANPAVGITLRLVQVKDGRTLWQGSSSKLGHAFSSLTSTAQETVRDLISKMPWPVQP